MLKGMKFACFIPFELFSFLPHKAYGWHDTMTGTYVEKLGSAGSPAINPYVETILDTPEPH